MTLTRSLRAAAVDGAIVCSSRSCDVQRSAWARSCWCVAYCIAALVLAAWLSATQCPTRPSAHNARFDFHFLNAEFSRARWEGGVHLGICTLALARKVLCGQEGISYRLGDLVQVGRSGCWCIVELGRLFSSSRSRFRAQRLSLNARNSHRAHDDAHATALLLQLLLREAEVTARCSSCRIVFTW